MLPKSLLLCSCLRAETAHPPAAIPGQTPAPEAPCSGTRDRAQVPTHPAVSKESFFRHARTISSWPPSCLAVLELCPSRRSRRGYCGGSSHIVSRVGLRQQLFSLQITTLRPSLSGPVWSNICGTVAACPTMCEHGSTRCKRPTQRHPNPSQLHVQLRQAGERAELRSERSS